jgi:hypothetical protein
MVSILVQKLLPTHQEAVSASPTGLCVLFVPLRQDRGKSDSGQKLYHTVAQAFLVKMNQASRPKGDDWKRMNGTIG